MIMNGTLEMYTAGINNKRRQRGFSLLEVLIAILVLSIGLLGLAQMQSIGLRSTHGAYLRTQATLLSGEILDSMRANLTAARKGEYNVDFGETPTGTTIADDDVNAWLTNLDPLLPNGQIQIKTNPDPNLNPDTTTSDVTIAIRWNEIRHQNETIAQPKTFTVDTTL